MVKSAYFSIGDLVKTVNDWCREQHVYPATNQMSTALTERTIRYYRTFHLLDPPVDNGLKYARKHLFQLMAVRLLQSQSLSLPRIRSLLFGKSEAELDNLITKGLTNLQKPNGDLVSPRPEQWIVVPLDRQFLLLCRYGRTPTDQQLEQIKTVLNARLKERNHYDAES